MANKKKKFNKINVRGNINNQPTNTGVKAIIITQPYRGVLDIGDYIKALKAAENVDFPNRAKLYDIYDEVLMDPHLTAVIQKRKAAVLNTPIEFKRDGVVDAIIGEQIKSPWFRNFLSDLLDTVQWGHSLFQFRRDGNWLNYDLIPRKHVDPVRQIVMQQQTDIHGDSFDEFADVLSVGKPRDLGLLAKAAAYVIYKRNGFSDFAQYLEQNGQPIREATYDAADEEMRQKLANDLYNMGGLSVLIHPEGTKINLHDSTSKGQSGELYNRFDDICDNAISKLELGNTLTTETGDHGTQALGTVHQGAEDKVVQDDKQLVLAVLNYEITDIFRNLGFDTTGGEFSFIVPQNKDLSARILIDCALKNQVGLPMADEYFYETYGVPKPDNYDEIKRPRLPAFPGVNSNNLQMPHADQHEDANKSPQEVVDENKEKGFMKFANWAKGLFKPKAKKMDFRGKMNNLYRAAAGTVENPFLFSQQALEDAILKIYTQDFNPQTEIEEHLFTEIWDAINKATDQGFNFPMPGDQNYDFCQEIKQNNAVFAAFKTHRMQNDIAAQLLDDKGQLKTFSQFRQDTATMVDHQVENWLQTEYETAVHRAHQAADWKQFIQEKDILPNLKWNKSTSINPGKDHIIYWDHVWSIDDPFWQEHRPGDRWGCKCSLTSTDEPVTDNSGLSDAWEPSPGLGGNPGITGQLFSDDHPYYTDTYQGANTAVKKLFNQ